MLACTFLFFVDFFCLFGIQTKRIHTRKTFLTETQDTKDGNMELMSFPLSREESQLVHCKFVIFNIEVFFKDISLFYTLARNRKFRMDQVSYEQLIECLGGELYYEKLSNYLKSWSRNAALFVIHPYCITSQLDAVLEKIDFLDYFQSDIGRFVQLQSMCRFNLAMLCFPLYLNITYIL